MQKSYDKIGLYKHNKESYERVHNKFLSGEKRVAILQATGTGKTYQALQLILDHPEKKSLFIAPNNSIIEHIINTINSNPNLDFKRDFPNLKFMTYQGLSTMEDNQIKDMDVDLAVFDEFHHIGAPVWGSKINTFVNTHPDAWLFGMSAYSVRRRGTEYERDMAKDGGNEIFSDKVVTKYDMADAMVDGVLPIPTFKSAYLDIEKRIDDLERAAKNVKNIELKENLEADLRKIRKLVTSSSDIQKLIKDSISLVGKYIYFCPPGKSVTLAETEEEADELENEKNVNINRLIDSHEELMRNLLNSINLVEGIDFTFYKTLSDMPDQGEEERNDFYSDLRELLRIIFNINQYGEGVHAPEVNGIIMARSTGSDIVAFEQIGRALSVDYAKSNYSSLSLDELRKLAVERKVDENIRFDENLSEEEQRQILIDRLCSPLIIDLAGNIKFIEQLEEAIRQKVENYHKRGIKACEAAERLYNGQFSILSINNSELNRVLDNLKSKIKVDKIAEFIETIEAGNTEAFAHRSSLNFSNGDSYAYFWYEFKERIKDELTTNPKYANYFTARKLIHIREYYAVMDNKIHEFIRMLENGNRGILTHMNPYEFENGDKLARFYQGHRAEIKDRLKNDPRYKNFNLARLFVEEYEFFNKVDNKLIYFIELLNEGNTKVLLYDNGMFFPNGTSMNQYYTMYKDRIHELVDNNPKYAAAKKYLADYEFYSVKANRIAEFIEILNAGNADILNAKNNHTFANGTAVGKLWSDMANKKLIKNLLATDPKYAEGYDTAKRLIAEYEYNNDASNKYHEFIEMINEGHAEALLVKNDFTFKNGSSASHFYSKKKEIIWELLNSDPKYAVGYDTAKRLIAEYEYDHDITYRIADIIELFNTGNLECLRITSNINFKNGDSVARFWIVNREIIMSVLLSDSKYAVGYETAKEVIREYEKKHDDTSKRKLAKIHNLPYEKVMDIPISELYAKCEYLKSIHVKAYENDKVHPIFMMSNANMAKRYGITLEELINNYVLIWSR